MVKLIGLAIFAIVMTLMRLISNNALTREHGDFKIEFNKNRKIKRARVQNSRALRKAAEYLRTASEAFRVCTCGASNRKGAKFCRKCGKRVAAALTADDRHEQLLRFYWVMVALPPAFLIICELILRPAMNGGDFRLVPAGIFYDMLRATAYVTAGIAALISIMVDRSIDSGRVMWPAGIVLGEKVMAAADRQSGLALFYIRYSLACIVPSLVAALLATGNGSRVDSYPVMIFSAFLMLAVIPAGKTLERLEQLLEKN